MTSQEQFIPLKPWGIFPILPNETEEDRLERLLCENALMGDPSIFLKDEASIHHYLAEGCYIREAHLKAGQVVVGHRHTVASLNVLAKGKVILLYNGETEIIEAPHHFVSSPGTRKAVMVLEDAIWRNVHETEETDLEVLEETIIQKTPVFREFEKIRNAMLAEMEVLT